jgi:hypothetical protein
MLSTQYRLRLEAICEKIVAQEAVGLEGYDLGRETCQGKYFCQRNT